MSDQDIIDIIAGAMRRRVRHPTDEAAQHNARAVLAALRERYAIVPRPEPPIGGYEHIVESGKKRYATVELPESDDDGEWDGQDEGWWVSAHRAHELVVGRRRVVPHLYRDSLHPNAARRFAAALLAATDAAEEGK